MVLKTKKGTFCKKIPFFEPLVGFEPTTPRLQITCSGQLSLRGGWTSASYRTATTKYPCYVPILGDSEGAGRMRLVRLINLKAVIAFKRVQKYCFFLNLPNVLYKNFRSLTFV